MYDAHLEQGFSNFFVLKPHFKTGFFYARASQTMGRHTEQGRKM